MKTVTRMKTVSRFGATLVLALLASTSRAALVDVGNGLINHPAANLTWVADANLFRTMATSNASLVTQIVAAWTNGPILTLAGGVHVIVAADFDAATGRMNWYGAQAWVNYLNVTHYKGYSDWRLPEVGTADLQAPSCGDGCVPDDGFALNSSEWWRLFFEELGGTAHVAIATSNNGSYSLFQNIEGDGYWGRAQNGTSTVWFRDRGEQLLEQTSVVGMRAWAVRVGQSVVNPPLAPHISFSPGNPVFPLQPYNTPFAAGITLKNDGTGAATIGSITGSGDFAVTHNCGTTLAVDATCIATVTFKPTELLTRTGTLTVDVGTVYTTALTGTGGLSASLSSSASSAKEGKSVTLTWDSSPHAVCEGVGGTEGWAGPLMQSGSRSVSSENAGIYVYSIRCTHDAQTLPAIEVGAQVVYTNVVKGALDWTLTLALALLVLLRLVKTVRTRHNRAE